MRIRRATEADFEAIAELCATAYEPFVGDDHQYMAELRDVAPRAAAAQVLVAGDESGVLGAVTFVPDGGPLREIATPGEAEFRMLAVAARACGHGVGTAPMEHVLEAARGAGKAGIVCSTLPEMRAAHRIYERLAFTAHPSATGRRSPASTCSRTRDPSDGFSLFGPRSITRVWTGFVTAPA